MWWLPIFADYQGKIFILNSVQQQQQQQHSILSQASWGRLEMKPKRHKSHGSGTLTQLSSFPFFLKKQPLTIIKN